MQLCFPMSSALDEDIISVQRFSKKLGYDWDKRYEKGHIFIVRRYKNNITYCMGIKQKHLLTIINLPVIDH